MHFVSRRLGWRRFAWLLLCVMGGAQAVLALYEGPVPRPGDVWGRPGSYRWQTVSFPSPEWPGAEVTVYLAGDGEARPTWFFMHGYTGSEPRLYQELMEHWASHGWNVVFSPSPNNGGIETMYAIIEAGWAEAVARYPSRFDLSRVGFAGHSFGGGAAPVLLERAWRLRGWGRQGLALLQLAPWYSYSLSNDALAALPPHLRAVCMVYMDDEANDHRMAIDIWRRLPVPKSQKSFLLLHADEVEGYPYRADHSVPVGTFPSDDGRRVTNALDAWGVWRSSTALGYAAFSGDAEADAAILRVSTSRTWPMGRTSAGRELRPGWLLAEPSPIVPSSAFTFRYDAQANPRRLETVPEANERRVRLTNLSVRASSGPGEETLIVGAAVGGEVGKWLLFRGVGPGLRAFGVSGVLPDPQLAWYRGGTLDLRNDDWGTVFNVSRVQALSAKVGAFALAPESRDAALLATQAVPGTVTVHLPAAARGVALLEAYDADLLPHAELRNLSARARLGQGDATLIGGFVLTGVGSRTLLVRGVGPTLAGFGVSGTVADPEITLYRDTEVLGRNDQWDEGPTRRQAVEQAAGQVGAFALPAGSSDAALLVDLPAGKYTVHMTSKTGVPGTGLLEVYSLDPAP